MSKQCSNTASDEVRVFLRQDKQPQDQKQQFKHSGPVHATIQVHVYILKHMSLEHASAAINKDESAALKGRLSL